MAPREGRRKTRRNRLVAVSRTTSQAAMSPISFSTNAGRWSDSAEEEKEEAEAEETEEECERALTALRKF